MKLSEMKTDPKNQRTGTICDPCDTEARREAAITRILTKRNALPDNDHKYILPHDTSKSLPCHRIPHVAADCKWEPNRCTCACHQSPVQALVLYHKAGDTLPNSSGTEVGSPQGPDTTREAFEIARRERLTVGFKASLLRSDTCCKPDHAPMHCLKAWCECACHAQEATFARLVRCGHGVKGITVDGSAESQVRIGNKIGHLMWVGMEDGTAPVRMIMMPDGSLIDYTEVA